MERKEAIMGQNIFFCKIYILSAIRHQSIDHIHINNQQRLPYRTACRDVRPYSYEGAEC